MRKARALISVLFVLGAASVALAQQPVQLKFSRVVDLTLPIESDVAGIPGFNSYADNPSLVDLRRHHRGAEGQLQTEGLTVNSNVESTVAQ